LRPAVAAPTRRADEGRQLRPVTLAAEECVYGYFAPRDDSRLESYPVELWISGRSQLCSGAATVVLCAPIRSSGLSFFQSAVTNVAPVIHPLVVNFGHGLVGAGQSLLQRGCGGGDA